MGQSALRASGGLCGTFRTARFFTRDSRSAMSFLNAPSVCESGAHRRSGERRARPARTEERCLPEGVGRKIGGGCDLGALGRLGGKFRG